MLVHFLFWIFKLSAMKGKISLLIVPESRELLIINIFIVLLFLVIYTYSFNINGLTKLIKYIIC